MMLQRLLITCSVALLATVSPFPALAFDFDWNSIGWNNGQTTSQTFNSVDGSTVNVEVITIGDTGQLTNGTPALYNVGGNNELRVFPNFGNTSQSITTRFIFSQAVYIENLIIKDLDSDGYSDGVRVAGFSGGVGGTSVDPNGVILGSAVVQTSSTEFDADQNGRQWGYTDPEGWVTTNFNGGTVIDVLEITHFPGQWAPSNPSGQAITFSDFEFFPATEDSSDAPASYGQATHGWSGTSLVYLGAVAPDAEIDDLASADALGDDNNNVNDEEGVEFTASGDGTQTITASITVTNNTGGNVRVCGWLDQPVTGTVGAFERLEGQCTSASGSSVQFSWSGLPTDQPYTTYARFRISSQRMGRNRFTGHRRDGEVEDYELTFDFTPTLVTIGGVDLAATPVVQLLGRLGIPNMDREQLQYLNLHWQPERAHELEGADTATLQESLTDFLDPDGDGEVAVMSWDTLEERGTVGFYVERRSPGDRDWQRINNRLLPGLITAPMGGEYQLADPQARASTRYEYQLIELEARGSTKTYGPFALQFE